ncbi:MAG: hypothetical protein AAGB22_12300, partial [Bacteroidota bacterium]
DDFTLEVVSPDQLDVETMVATSSCEGDEFAITYTICSDQAVNGLSLNVALPPLGMHYTAGGDFTNGVLNGLSIPANGCVDVTLNVGFDPGTAVGTAFNLQLNATGNTFCLSTTSQVNTLLTKLAPANNPLSMTLVDITNTPPYSAGDLVDLEVTFTNSDPTQAVTQVNTAVTTLFPLLQVNNNIPPTFTVNPNSSVTYTYQLQIGTASFCDLVETCVIINSASNACGLPMSACVDLDVQNAQWPLVQIQFNKGITADLQEDPTGNVYLTGHLVSGTVNNQSQTGSSFFLSKIDECGQEEWGRRSFPLPGGNGWSDSYSVTRDNANNVYISGAHREGVTFEGGTNNDLTVFTFGGVNNTQYGYIASYTEDGDLRWVLQQLNMNHSEINEVQFDPNTGDLYATGTADHNQGSFFILYTQTGVSFAGILNASPNPPHSRAATAMRLTTNGQIAWNRHFITDGNTFGRY